MQVIHTNIPDILILKPRVFKDSRGYFFESFSQREFDEKVAQPYCGHPIHFLQDNESMSSYGVIRGLHYQQMPYTQTKIVRCVKGRVLDIAVDIRQGSPTFGQHVAVEISEENHLQVFIPKGFAHGFAVLSDSAIFQYKCDCLYEPASEGGIQPLDPRLGIDWKINPAEAILSDKDLARPCLYETASDFHFEENLYEQRSNGIITAL